MKKIISLFKRDYEGNKQVYNEVVPGAEWVINGEGVATRKYDGTCCMILDGKLYKRFTVKKKHIDKGIIPENFIPATEIDPVTNKQEGWLPVTTEDKWHNEAFKNTLAFDGTYELVGPKVQGNPEGFKEHVLLSHGGFKIFDVPRTFNELKEWLEDKDIEGIVWHHEDGRMVKIKKKDFGLKRK